MRQDLLQIDVEKVFIDKAPKIAKKTPRFIFSILKKFIHQEGINKFLRTCGHLQGVEFATAMMEYWNATLIVKGLENLPKDKQYVFASNHPLGGLDGVALTSILGQAFEGKIRFVVNDILMNVKNFSPIFVPVNKHGGQAKEYADLINGIYNSDLQIIFFPAGLVSRKQNGRIEDLEWKKSFIAKAIQYKRDVVPIHFDGKNSRFFYSFARFRKLIRIKANIEMLALPRELFKQQGKTFVIQIGEPIPWQTFDKSRTTKAWAEYVKNAAYALKDRK